MGGKKKVAKRRAGAQPGNTFTLKWSLNLRKELCKELIEIAKDDEKIEYTLKQICYRAGHAYDNINKLQEYWHDVSLAWKEVKSILQKRWLDLAIKNEGNSKVVNQFLEYHSTEILDQEDARDDEKRARELKNDVKKAKQVEKIKADEKIRTQNALIADNKDTLTDIYVAAQAIQDINAKKKQEKLED